MSRKASALIGALFILLSGLETQAHLRQVRPTTWEEGKRLQELRLVADDLHKVILARDIDRLLQYARQDQDSFSYDILKRDLHDRKSQLYGNLFDSEVLKRFVKADPVLPSVRDFFLNAKDVKTMVGFYKDGGVKRPDWGWIIYRASNYSRKQSPMATLYYSDGRWWVTDLFEHRP